MNSTFSRLAALAISTVCIASATAQTTVSIIADRDNSLYFSGTGANSNGQGELFVGITGSGFGDPRRCLMHFDVAGNLPADAVVIGAEIEFEITNTVTQSEDDAFFHRVTQDWGEGASGSQSTSVPGQGGGIGFPAATNDATWLHTFSPSSLWTNPGGDFEAEASFLVLMPNPGGPLTSITATGSNMPGLVADVQDMLDSPATNFGWLLKVDENAMVAARRLNSRESATGKPTLRVTYLQPSDVASVGIGCPVGGGNSTFSFTGAAIGGQTLTINRSNTVTNSIGADFFSLGLDASGVLLQPGCLVYLPLGMEIVGGSAFLSMTGSSTSSVLVPSGFPGEMIACQSVVLDDSPVGLSLSNAAVMILQ